MLFMIYYGLVVEGIQFFHLISSVCFDSGPFWVFFFFSLVWFSMWN